MSVELEFPLEFIVMGNPVSLQAKRAEARTKWAERVKQASSAVLPDDHFATDQPLSVTLFYFPGARRQGDIDNIVKPVLDALSRHVYIDDKQIERVWVQRFEPDRVFPFSRPSMVLAAALAGEKPLLFIRIGDDLAEGLE